LELPYRDPAGFDFHGTTTAVSISAAGHSFQLPQRFGLEIHTFAVPFAPTGLK
jgi:hypothetical protein